MTATFPGYKPPTDLVIDAGVLYYGNADPTLATAFGTTRDGFTFDTGMETRDVPFDGGHSPFEGLSRITAWNATLKGKFLTITAANMLLFNPGSASDGSSGNNVLTMKKAGNLFQSADYISHLWLIGRQQVDGTLVRVHFPLAYAASMQIVTKHNDEWLVDTTIKAVLPTGSDPQECPFFYDFAS